MSPSSLIGIVVGVLVAVAVVGIVLLAVVLQYRKRRASSLEVNDGQPGAPKPLPSGQQQGSGGGGGGDGRGDTSSLVRPWREDLYFRICTSVSAFRPLHVPHMRALSPGGASCF